MRFSRGFPNGSGGFARRLVLAAGLVVAAVALVAWLPLAAGGGRRTVVLVAKDMAFYLDGESTPNPTIVVPAGAEVRIEVRNRDAGVTHDFAIKDLKVAMKPLKGEATGVVRFRAPDRPGRYGYVCNPHALMMNGILDVK